jgi:hypothetical protein
MSDTWNICKQLAIVVNDPSLKLGSYEQLLVVRVLTWCSLSGVGKYSD